jgi:RNase P/RNase MRP subunit p29
MKQETKRDTEINWKKAINFIPKKDEIILYDCENGPRIKIGDGLTKVNDLPFTQDIISINNVIDIDGETLIVKGG